MKKNLLTSVLYAGSLFIALSGYSQSGNNEVYTVTDSIREGVKWNCLRTLDLASGSYSNTMVRFLSNNEIQLSPSNTPSVLSSNGIAAIAHDKKNKRLYYTSLLTDRLAYIDLRTMANYVVTNHFTGLMPKAADQSNMITRMVIGDDDKGYALTNDGRHLIRFKTNNNSITDLGSLVDAPGNNEMSVHNGCSSFGGDIVADDEDHLYLVTVRNHVFKINLDTKVAKYLGTVNGLPATFTTGGAAVDKSKERIILVSATDASGVYSLNLKPLFASKLNVNRPWLTSDLATSYILKDKDGDHHRANDMIVEGNSGDNDHVQLYPNPVTNKEFKLQFTDAPAGIYTIEVIDVRGKSIATKTVTIGGKSNIVSASLPEQVSNGIYIVRITDNSKKAFFSGKIVVQQ